MKKQRLDILLVDLNLCASRQIAQRAIQAGEVRVNQQVVDKVGTEIRLDAVIELQYKPPFVSRGGEKLAKALAEFGVSVVDRVCLDGGISTGGFTDCLFQAGAKLVYGIDVGYGQVDWKIRTDERLVLKERVNLRYLKPAELYPAAEIRPDLGVVDVSFISLTKVLPALWELITAPREMILLVKPQFEVGREAIGKKGVVRDPVAQTGAIEQVISTAQRLGWQERGLTFSPMTGPAGNIEYLLWLGMASEAAAPPTMNIKATVDRAHQTLAKASAESDRSCC